MIRAMTLASNQVELTVLSKSDIPKYKTLQEQRFNRLVSYGIGKQLKLFFAFITYLNCVD